MVKGVLRKFGSWVIESWPPLAGVWFVVGLLLVGGRVETRAWERVELRLQGTAPLCARSLSVRPAYAVRELRTYPDRTVVFSRRAGVAVQLEAPQHCATTVAAAFGGGRGVAVPLRLRFPEDPGPLGFGAEVSFEVVPGCGERPRILWQQVEGTPLPRLVARSDGYRLQVRMPDAPTEALAPLGVGIVPISPRTQGRVVLEARSAAGDTHRLQLVATSRATGLPSVAVSQQLLLAGSGWHVERAAPGGQNKVVQHGGLARFEPDAPGRWWLRDAQGTQLALSAFSHDKTPLDCGRAECHPSVASAAEHSPMSHALERSLAQRPLAAVSCMLDCHVSGERGLHDGGFLDVQAQLGWSGTERTRWEDLPQPLRRLGGVRCTSCHGPGAIPDARERALLLRNDVCATCHDAPPVYPHVSALASTRMAKADADPRTREAPCARCHSTQGFLEHTARRKPQPNDAAMPPTGISCAACHAPHAQEHGERLVRRVASADPELPANDALCAECHAPTSADIVPFASSAALWSGRLQLPAADGTGTETLQGPAPHRDVPGGCVGCHGRTAGGRLDHTFAAKPERCTTCHDSKPKPDRELVTRAGRLVTEIEQACAAVSAELADGPSSAQRGAKNPTSGRADASSSAPPHARDAAPCNVTPLARARYLARLVAEDPAAAVHNPALARQLLSEAESSLSAQVARRTRQ